MYGFRYTIVIHDRKKLQDAKSLFIFVSYQIHSNALTNQISKWIYIFYFLNSLEALIIFFDFSVNIIYTTF